MPLNASFKVVAWRGTTNIADGIMGISFDHADGEITRLALNVESARALADTVTEYLDAYANRMNTQSPISSFSVAKELGPVELNLLIAKLARYAAMADRGVNLGSHGGISRETIGHHKGGAKAYRHAIDLVMQAQRDISRSAKAREQQTI